MALRPPTPCPSRPRHTSVRRLLLAAAVAGSLCTATACADPAASGTGAGGTAKGDCGYAYVFDKPVTSSTAEQTIEKGLKRAQARLHVRIDTMDGDGVSTVADNLRAEAQKGCYRAIGTAFLETTDAVTQVASEYPHQRFFVQGGGGSRAANVTSYASADEQGTYVIGAMAATMTRSGTIGIITGDDSPGLRRYVAGYLAGAKAARPSVKVLANVVGSFTDPAKTGAIAETQASRGADLIYSAAGSNLQVYSLGRTHHYGTIASDLSDYAAAEPSHPALAFIGAEAEDDIAYDIVKGFDGTTPPRGSVTISLRDGLYSIPYVTDSGTSAYRLPANVIAAGKKAYSDVVSGRVKVPSS